MIKTDGDFGVLYAAPLEGSDKLRYFPVPWRGASVPQIPLFKGRPAPLANNYLRYFDNRRRRRLVNYDYETLRSVEGEYVKKLLDLERVFGHLFTSYDTEVVLKSTCALGMLRPAHFDMDEKGIFGTGRTKQYDPEILSLYEKDLMSLSELADETISMKRGTNLGWPTPKGGRARDESDILLALHVAAVQGARCRGLDLTKLTQLLESWYGPCFAIAGERYQTTERVIPVIYVGGSSVYHNFAQRVRGIYFSPKFMVAWNRRYVKTILPGIMKHPMHAQDRDEIKKTMAMMNQPSWLSVSVDVSRFDQSHGIEVVEPILRVFARVCAHHGLGSEEQIFQDLMTEFLVPDVVPTSRDLLWERGGQILSSGLSMTSLVGCSASHCIAYTIARYVSQRTLSEVRAGFGKWWNALTWGDDIVFGIDKKYIYHAHEIADRADLTRVVAECGQQELDLKLADEPTIKFLGQNYDMLSYTDATTGYPVGRFIQQQYFPERSKNYPFDVIGYIARLSMLDESVQKAVHEAVLKLWPFEYAPFPYEKRSDVLAQLLPEVEKFSHQISQLDDVFGIFTHGLDPGDIDMSDYSEFSDLLALGSVDVTDPAEFLLSSNKQISRDLLRLISKIQNGEVGLFHSAVDQIAPLFNSKSPVSGQLYY